MSIRDHTHHPLSVRAAQLGCACFAGSGFAIPTAAADPVQINGAGHKVVVTSYDFRNNRSLVQ